MKRFAVPLGIALMGIGCDRPTAKNEAPAPPAVKAETPQQIHAKAMSRLANASAAAAANFDQSGQGIYLKELADRLRGFSNEGGSNPDSAAQKLAEASAADALAKYQAAKNAAIMADPEVIAAQAEVKAAFAALPHVPAPAPIVVASTPATSLPQPDPISAPQVSPPLPSHRLVNETIQDLPGKAQADRSYLLTAPATAAGVEALLRDGLAIARKRRGFRYHSAPTMVAVYVFTTENRVGTSAFAGFLAWREGEEASVTVNERMLEQQTQPTTLRFGKTEAERQTIWEAAASARYRSEDEADARFIGKGLGKEGLRRAAAEGARLREIYEGEVMTRHKISREQLDAILAEAIEKQWPMPKRPPRR